MLTTSPRRSRRTTVTVAAAAAVALLAGCSAGPGETPGGEFTGEYDGPAVTLSFWNGFTGGDGPFMQGLVDQFNEEHENITVESNTMQWSDFYQRLPAAVTAGEGPDVGAMHFDQLGSNAARQVIMPLDDMAEQLELTADDFTEAVWEAGVYADERYGIPLDIHSLAMYYNTEHFEAAGITEPPTDAESFQAALDALQAAGYETPFWMPSRWPAHLMFLSLDWQYGGEPYAADGTAATFGDEAGVQSLEWMRSMVEQGYSPADVAQDAQYVAFKNGETSITWDGIWQFNDLDASGLPYAAAPIPAIGGEQAAWASSHQFFLPRQEDPDRINAAKVFIAWMSEHSADWAQAGMIPARQSVRDEGALEGTPQEPLAESLDAMRFIPTTPGIGTVQTETVEVAVAEGVLGQGEPAAVLEAAQGTATQLMEENLEAFGE
ncbi:multiple sugar transport system substrate-binding protein [Agrococcus sp. UYP10]|uniref:ABC transporter substrate-binding protein n=1 Tax=Agrococcus sp. UYP10 TaxID=1756355 RepID=UPI0033925EEA